MHLPYVIITTRYINQNIVYICSFPVRAFSWLVIVTEMTVNTYKAQLIFVTFYIYIRN
jgi:hypothetical protein